MDPNATSPVLELVLYGRTGVPVDRRTWMPRDGLVTLHPEARQLRITVLSELDTDPAADAKGRQYVAVRPSKGGVKLHLASCPAVAQARPDRRFPQPAWMGLDRAAIVRKRAATRRRQGLGTSQAELTADLHGCVR
jgi:hypothetical protein